MLLFYNPTQPPSWDIKIVKDEHSEAVYVADEGCCSICAKRGGAAMLRT